MDTEKSTTPKQNRTYYNQNHYNVCCYRKKQTSKIEMLERSEQEHSKSICK